ncbi:MAG: ABC transporter permease [Thermodesulfobacteriota bacterium]
MSIDIRMAWRNVWRNPRRTVLTISAIVFAGTLLIFMLSFQLGSYGTMINASVRIHTGHLQVQAKGYQDKKSMRLVVPNPSAVGELIQGIPEVEAYTFRANAFSLVSSKERTYGALVIGVDPVRESQVSTLKQLIRQGDYLDEHDTNQALAGELLAKNLRVEVGDELTILGQGRDGSIAATVVKVKGIYKSGMDDFDRSAIHIPLKLFQDVYAMRGAVHEVVAVGTSLSRVSEMKKAIQAGLKRGDRKNSLLVLDWDELMPGLLQAIKLDLVGGIIFWFLLIVVVAFSILNTFLMAIFERTREFGVLMAIGTSPGRLTRLLLIESAAMTIIGILIGTLFGCLLTWYFQVHGIDLGGASELMSQYGISGKMYPRLSLITALSGPGAVLIITLLTALYPAFKVRRLRPTEAMRAV